MFWRRPQNRSAVRAHCLAKYGVAPRVEWIGTEFGGRAGVAAASNIVFSNGLYDPWSSGGVGVAEARAAGGVARMGRGGSVVAAVIEQGAHHLDLFWANAADPEQVRAVRRLELAEIAKWTAAHRAG